MNEYASFNNASTRAKYQESQFIDPKKKESQFRLQTKSKEQIK